MPVSIRHARAGDAPAIAALLRPVEPLEQLTTPATVLHRWTRPVRRRRGLWLVACDGTALIGHLAVEPNPFMPADTLDILVAVDPEARRRGLGSELLERGLAHAAADGAVRVRSRAQVPTHPGAAFLSDHGFGHTATFCQWTVDPRSAQLDALRSHREAAQAPGVTVVPLSGCTDMARALSRLFAATADNDARPDTPHPRVPFHTWRRAILDDPTLSFDGSVVALDGGHPVALCWIRVDPDTREAAHEFTVTAPTHRGRGLARCLKLEVLGWARENGMVALHTSNSADNHTMLGLNRRLGYRRRSDWCAYVRNV